MKKRRIKKSVIKKAILLLMVIIVFIILSKVISTIKYHKTDEYKLKKIGYNLEEIKVILSANDENKNYVLNNEYNEFIDDFINEKYYISNNLERYLNYKKTNESKSTKEITSIVNVNADNEWYTNTKKTDLTKGNLMLINKFNYVDEDYEIDNVEKISSRYAYDDNWSNKEMMEKYKKMFNDAEEQNLDLIITSGFRKYSEQEEIYEEYKEVNGEEYANNYAAKPGFSEHQTGYAFDIITPGATMENFEETEEFKWLKQNAHKYGFIMRYPKGKEKITGYKYEPWHYRYVGTEVAQKIKNENITFDEYYAFYIENK